jgi:hypothetical protein
VSINEAKHVKIHVSVQRVSFTRLAKPPKAEFTFRK